MKCPVCSNLKSHAEDFCSTCGYEFIEVLDDQSDEFKDYLNKKKKIIENYFKEQEDLKQKLEHFTKKNIVLSDDLKDIHKENDILKEKLSAYEGKAVTTKQELERLNGVEREYKKLKSEYEASVENTAKIILENQDLKKIDIEFQKASEKLKEIEKKLIDCNVQLKFYKSYQ